MSQRLLRVLGSVDVVAAERGSHANCSRAMIWHPPQLVSFREDNQESAGPQLLSALQSGQQVALVTDTGIPGISDPGTWLDRGVPLARRPGQIVPGPSASLAALLASGFDCRRFVFEGFLPRHGRIRAQRLQALASKTRAVVLFEAPHRVRKTLEDLARVVPQHQYCTAREITKKFEEVRIDTAGALREWLKPHGEFTLVIEGGEVAPAEAPPMTTFCASRSQPEWREKPPRPVEMLGVPKRIAYQRYLEFKSLSEKEFG